MIERYNSKCFASLLPGLVLQTAGYLFKGPYALTLVVLGTIMVVAACAYLAKAKGRNPLWGLLAVAGLPGMIVFVFATFEDRSGDPWQPPPDEAERLEQA